MKFLKITRIAAALFSICTQISARPYTDLMDAICNNNTREVKRLLPLVDPSDLNARPRVYGGDTLLTRALKFTQTFDTAQSLIKAGANVNTSNVRGSLPLSMAVSKVTSHDSKDSLLQKLFLISSLVKAGADVNQQAIEDDEYLKSMNWGSRIRDTYKADRTTPLMRAMHNIPLCCWLIKHGADPSIKDKDGLDTADHFYQEHHFNCNDTIDYEKFVTILRDPHDPKNAKFIDKGAAYIDKMMKNAQTKQASHQAHEKLKSIKSKYHYVRNRELGIKSARKEQSIIAVEERVYDL